MRTIARHLGVQIRGAGRAVPGPAVTNADLLRRHPDTHTMSEDARVRLAERFGRMTGIKARHLARLPGAKKREGEATSQSLALDAIRLAIGSTDGSALGALVHGTTTSGRYTGAQGPVILAGLNSRAPSFEIKAGCSTSLVSLDLAASLLQSGHDNVMVACAETLSKVIDLDNRDTWFILADGGAAVWLQRADASPHFEILRTLYQTDGWLANAYTTQGSLPPNQEDLDHGGYVLRGDGARLETAARQAYLAMLDVMLPRAEDRKRIRWIIAHQVNRRIISAVTDTAGLTAELVWSADRVGNLGGTSVLFSLAEAWERRTFEPGDEILMMSVGGGLSYAMQHWRTAS